MAFISITHALSIQVLMYNLYERHTYKTYIYHIKKRSVKLTLPIIDTSMYKTYVNNCVCLGTLLFNSITLCFHFLSTVYQTIQNALSECDVITLQSMTRS